MDRNIVSFKHPLTWYALATILFLAYILIGQTNETLFFSIFHLSGNSVIDMLMRFCAAYLYLCIIATACIWYIATQKGSYLKTGIIYLAVGIVAYLLSILGTHLIIDPRPYLQYHLTPLISVAKDNGFPSDHTMLAFATASITSLFAKKISIPLFIAAGVVGFARIYVTAHHPVDIAGSMIIVLFALVIVFIIHIPVMILLHKKKAE